MKSYLQLVRFPNLLMIAFTMYAMRLFLIRPILAANEQVLQLGNLDFFLLVLSTVFITAAGYGINDYFDQRTDALNRPHAVVVGKVIKRRVAMALHWFFNTTAVLVGLYLSIKIGHWQFSALFLGTTGLLWYYSTTYKRQFLIGNIIVALLTAMVPVLVLLFEVPLLNVAYGEWLIAHNTDFMVIVKWVLAFAFFAFLTTLIREIIKDIEDFEGDRAFGRNTLPVVLGITATKYILAAMLLGTVALLYVVYFLFLGDRISLIYITATLALPMLYVLLALVQAKLRVHYTRASLVMKITMLFGIGYLGVLVYNLQQL